MGETDGVCDILKDLIFLVPSTVHNARDILTIPKRAFRCFEKIFLVQTVMKARFIILICFDMTIKIRTDSYLV